MPEREVEVKTWSADITVTAFQKALGGIQNFGQVSCVLVNLLFYQSPKFPPIGVRQHKSQILPVVTILTGDHSNAARVDMSNVLTFLEEIIKDFMVALPSPPSSISSPFSLPTNIPRQPTSPS